MAETPRAERGERAYRALDVAVALLFVALGLVIAWQVAAKLPLFRFGQVGPGLLPAGVAVVLVGAGATVAVRALRGLGAAVPDAIPTRREAGRVVALFALAVGCTLLMPLLGTIASLALFILVETLAVERRRLATGVVAAVLVPLFVWATFEALLGVPLPAGIVGLV